MVNPSDSMHLPVLERLPSARSLDNPFYLCLILRGEDYFLTSNVHGNSIASSCSSLYWFCVNIPLTIISINTRVVNVPV